MDEQRDPFSKRGEGALAKKSGELCTLGSKKVCLPGEEGYTTALWKGTGPYGAQLSPAPPGPPISIAPDIKPNASAVSHVIPRVATKNPNCPAANKEIHYENRQLRRVGRVIPTGERKDQSPILQQPLFGPARIHYIPEIK